MGQKLCLRALATVLILSQIPAQAEKEIMKEKKLVVKGIKQDKGLLLVAFFATSDSWLGKEPKVGMDVPVKRDADGSMVIALPEELPEKFAVAIIHDENGNRDMDKNAIGIPKEPYGFSRNVRPKFGAPTFESALVGKDTPLEITVDTLL